MTTHNSSTEMTFIARDGYRLQGREYIAQTDTSKASLIIANATGVPQLFYRRFAEFMSQLGYNVYSFDYRGIGLSAPPSLKGFKMDYLDWGRLDLAAVIDCIAEKELPIFLVGHSYGGHALGLLDNWHKLTASYFFGTGVGWKGYMPYGERFNVSVVWNIVFPYLAAKHGYVPWSKLNMGADLPLGVYQQWKKWCKNPEYFFAAVEGLAEEFAQVRLPIYAATSIDDEWAMPISRDACMKYYRNADMHLLDLNPHKYGLKKFGHMGYFRRGSEQVWQEIDQVFASYLSR